MVKTAGYGAHVPAAARTVQALRVLAEAAEPLSLAQLSRALHVSPSSLLALLTTLRGLGLVARDGREGRYSPGPGLVALGAAAAAALEAARLFELVADDLVERLGESVLLWIAREESLVLATARAGTQPLRLVPPIGLRLSAESFNLALTAGPTGLLEGALWPGTWTLALPLPSYGRDGEAFVALVGPDKRLRGAAGAKARTVLHDAVRLLGPEPARGATWQQSGPIQPRELDAFLDQGLIATFSYIAEDGYPASVPLWYDWDGQAFWLAPRPGAEWAEHARRNPRASLAVSESTPPLRRVLVRGSVERVDDPDGTLWRRLAGRLARRYAGLDAARHLAGSQIDRQTLRLPPERVITWRGLLSHPRLRADTPLPHRDTA